MNVFWIKISLLWKFVSYTKLERKVYEPHVPIDKSQQLGTVCQCYFSIPSSLLWFVCLFAGVFFLNVIGI